MSLLNRHDRVRHRLARRGRSRILLPVVACAMTAALVTPSNATSAAEQPAASGGGTVQSFWLHISNTRAWDSSHHDH